MTVISGSTGWGFKQILTWVLFIAGERCPSLPPFWWVLGTWVFLDHYMGDFGHSSLVHGVEYGEGDATYLLMCGTILLCFLHRVFEQ